MIINREINKFKLDKRKRENQVCYYDPHTHLIPSPMIKNYLIMRLWMYSILAIAENSILHNIAGVYCEHNNLDTFDRLIGQLYRD